MREAYHANERLAWAITSQKIYGWRLLRHTCRQRRNIQRSSGAPQFRLFNVTASGSLTLSRLTVRGANAGGNDGGAVLNAGSLTLDDVTLTNNAARFGGAIYSTGALTIPDSVISG